MPGKGYDKGRGNEDGSSSNRCSTPFVLCIHIFKSHKAGDRIGPVNSLLISLANKPAAAGLSPGLVLRRWHWDRMLSWSPLANFFWDLQCKMYFLLVGKRQYELYLIVILEM